MTRDTRNDNLVGPQRVHRIDAQRPPHGDERRDERDDGEQQNGTA
jgi:hypothetical protein